MPVCAVSIEIFLKWRGNLPRVGPSRKATECNGASASSKSKSLVGGILAVNFVMDWRGMGATIQTQSRLDPPRQTRRRQHAERISPKGLDRLPIVTRKPAGFPVNAGVRIKAQDHAGLERRQTG